MKNLKNSKDYDELENHLTMY